MRPALSSYTVTSQNVYQKRESLFSLTTQLLAPEGVQVEVHKQASEFDFDNDSTRPKSSYSKNKMLAAIAALKKRSQLPDKEVLCADDTSSNIDTASYVIDLNTESPMHNVEIGASTDYRCL